MTAPFAPRRLTIATRESALALWQAEHVRAQLIARHPGMGVDLLGVTTQGDRVIDRPLATIGGKGLFIKELETAIREGRADLAVHSLKDVPMDLPDGFVLAAISAREDPRDAFVSTRYDSLSALPAGTVVGTSSLRREAQLRERYPALTIESLRGNVHTRLRKLDEGQYGAIILAAAGLKRLGLGTRIRALRSRGRACAARRSGHDARDDGGASIFARLERQLSDAARRVRRVGGGSTVAARPARHARRSRCLAR